MSDSQKLNITKCGVQLTQQYTTCRMQCFNTRVEDSDYFFVRKDTVECLRTAV